MTQRKKRSMQEARRLRRGRQQAFTGRHDQLALFREQLTLAGDDDRRRDVLNVYGQGGMGKSTLLNEFVRIAGDMSALAAITDHNEEDIPSAMARLATGLEEAGGDEAAAAFKTFNKRYDTYRQKRGELQADPKAPDGLAGLFGRAVAQTGFKVARNAAPGADFVVGLVEEPLTEQAGLWAEYVRRKLGDRDDVQLVLEPEAVLTPLFAAALEQLAAERRVALLFDTYERTSPALDGWLRDTLDGRHGDLPENLIVVIAGQYMLNHNAWANLLDTVAPLPLDPFAEEEARDYLTGKGITNERVVAVILALSDRMPLLLATLAAGAPQDPDQVGDASGTAVECFLKWVDDPARRALALDAALPRRLNRDVVETLGGDAPGFDWLITTPFVQRLRDDGGWVYHDVVRRQMLAHKRAESPAGWTSLHERLAAHYRAARDEINPDHRAGLREPAWRAAALEELYHRLCARPGRELGAGLNETVVMLEENMAHGIQWAAVLEAAGEDANHKTLRDWGMDLGQGLRAYLDIEQDEEIAVKAFSLLLDSKLLEPVNQTTVLAWRASSYRYMGRDEKALADYSRIIELKPDDAGAFTSRGNVFQKTGRYEEALADFDRAIELDPEEDWCLYLRAITHCRLHSAEWADDLNEAVRLATAARDTTPAELMNVFNLALYHVARGDADPAEALYREGIAAPPHDGVRLAALNDLSQHLSLFPDDSLARQMQALLVAAWGDLAAGSTAAAAGST